MGATSQRRKRTLTTTVMSSLKIAVQNSQYAHIFVIAINHLVDNTNGEDIARCISSYSLSIAMGHLDNGEGDGGLFLVLQQSFKE